MQANCELGQARKCAQLKMKRINVALVIFVLSASR
jgi:hypothetical protein